MKKLIAIMLSAVMILMMSGCKADRPASDQTVDPPTPTSPVIPAEVAENTEEDDIQLEQGFEAWEKSEAVRALNKVLTMEAPVKEASAQEGDTGADNLKQYYLNKIIHFLDYDFDQRMLPNQYAIVDLDHDGTPEVIVRLSVKQDSWIIILRYYKGSVYGYSHELREFEYPKMDGTYMASSEALDNMIMELSFDGSNIKEKRLGYSISGKDAVEYYIADNKVPEEEYNNFSEKYYNSEDVIWHLFPSELRARYSAEELFRVDFNAITQPMRKELESYYSDIETDTKISHSSRIPQELSDLMTEAMKSGKEEETFGPLENDTEIDQEEFCSLTGFELDVTEFITPVRVDADNDGIEDLMALCYWGGTGGFSSMQLYQGSEAGEYKLTSSFECLLQEYHFISYQGKSYLLMKNVDYNTKYYSGYTLYLYEDGILADGMNFWFGIEDYGMKIIYENSSFSGAEQVKNTLCNKELTDVMDNNDGVIDGTGEFHISSYRYSCDIDNDGDIEYYDKTMWYPSNMGTVMECSYAFDDSGVLEDLCARLADEMGEGRLYTFWIDEVDDVNIMYLYYGRNLDYTLYAYLLEGV